VAPVASNVKVDNGAVVVGKHKEKIPVKYKGIWDCVKKISKEEGYRGFYRGMLINCIRAIPSQAVQFATYGYLKEVLGVTV